MPDYDDPIRRRSPGWVRAFDDRALHGLLFKMERDRFVKELTTSQEWLWDAGISELEYRRRHTRPIWKACACRLCIPPFPF